eukprot:1169346-Prymnesium_polylepis.1
MSGWDFLEGKNKRIGARVMENAKLRQPPPPRAGPSRRSREQSPAGSSTKQGTAGPGAGDRRKPGIVQLNVRK